jgi:hypothetical protein
LAILPIPERVFYLPGALKMQKLMKYGSGLGALLVAGSSQAAIDVTAAMAEINDLPTVIATVGAALLVAAGTAVAYKWAKATFFS